MWKDWYELVHTAAPETPIGSPLRDPGHSHEWYRFVSPTGQSILLLGHQETHCVGAVVCAYHFGPTFT